MAASKSRHAKNSRLRPTETRGACWFPPFSELSGARGHNSSAFDVLPHFVSDSTSERGKKLLCHSALLLFNSAGLHEYCSADVQQL